jgi:3-hydroxyisobutyrate dehydrogenase-like beta-hydroxyacid dehydrogenase
MKPLTVKNNELGFIGIGYMGRPIAQRLLESGFKVIAYDRERSNAERLIPYGGTVAESVAELSNGCNVVLSCLPNDDAVRNVYEGPPREKHSRPPAANTPAGRRLRSSQSPRLGPL